MMTADLSKDQIEVFHQFIEEAEIVNVGGLEILVTTASALVTSPMSLSSCTSTWIWKASMPYLRWSEWTTEFIWLRGVALKRSMRARSPRSSAAGGHPTAASATIRDLSLYEARDKLVKLLEGKGYALEEAYQIMSRPVVTITPDRNLDDAAELLARYQISSLPVVDDGKIMGILHRQSVERASHHGLSEQPVVDFMDPDVVTVSLHDPMDAVIKIAVDGRRRLVPVVDNGTLVGVISRSDLLQHMKIPREKDYGGAEEFPSSRLRAKSVKRLLEEHFPDGVIRILRTAGEVAQKRGEDVYLVGGAVRDLLLRKYNLDIDLVVEGEGIPFSWDLAAHFPGCRVRGHDKFGTAALLFEDGLDQTWQLHVMSSMRGRAPFRRWRPAQSSGIFAVISR